MIRPLVVAAALVLLAAPAAGAKPAQSILDEVDHCPGENNMDLLQCAGGISAREDARLNRAYKAAMARLTPPRQKALRTAQRGWIKDRDAKCRAELDDGGAQAGIYATACVADMTHDRALELERAARKDR